MFELQGSGLMLPFDTPRGRTPQGGKVFFVHNGSGIGNDSHEGTDPQFPLASITEALVKCTAAKGDYIFVQHYEGTEFAGYPQVDLNKSYVHLIGLGSGSYGPTVKIVGGQDAPAILIGDDSYSVEIAGFNLGSGTEQDEPAIETTGDAYYVHIHHNGFGTIIRAKEGILIPANTALVFSSIDHNWFSRRLSGWGVHSPGGGGNSFTSSAMLHNLLKMADGVGGIYIAEGEPEAICFNAFGTRLGGDEGWAIRLGPSTVDAMVMGNYASETGDNTTGNNPYKDQSAATTPLMKNFWAANYKGEAETAPAGA